MYFEDDEVIRHITAEEYNKINTDGFIIQNGRLVDKEYASMSLQQFCDLIAEMMDKCPPNDLEQQDDIYNTINHYGYDNSSEEIQRFQIVTVCAEHGNLTAMLELARYDRDMDLPDESDSEQLYWLHKIIDDDRVKQFLKHIQENAELTGFSKESEENLALTTSAACYSLGLYYRASENMDKLYKAYEYLSVAKACRYITYPPSMTEKLLDELKKRIDRLEKYEANHTIEKEMISLFKDISIDELNVDDQINTLNDRLIKEIGLDVWNQLSEQTKSYLLTAVSCLYYLLHTTAATCEKLDFSCVTVLLMKCLEYELKIRFCKDYIDYLKPRYNIDEYYQINKINHKQDEHGGIFSPQKDENGRQIYENGDKKYTYAENPYKDFTLGSFIHATGVRRVDRKLPRGKYYSDKTMLDYCREVLFRDRNCTEEEADGWLLDFTIMVKDFPKFRNESAHGGYQKNECDAIFALDNLILAEHILIDLIKKCRNR